MPIALTGALTGFGRADVTATWLGGAGNWSSAALWSTNPNYPNNGTPTGVDYSAVINNAGTSAYTVTENSTITVDGITLSSANATLVDTGKLTVNGAIDLQKGDFSFDAGQVSNATIQSEGGTLTMQGSETLNNVELTMPLTIPQSQALFITNTLTLNGSSISMMSGNSGGSFYGSQISATGNSGAIEGTGTITFTSGYYSFIGMESTGQFTVGSGIVINSGIGGGELGAGGSNYPTGTFTNDGTINVTSGEMSIVSNNIVNQGVINVSGGSLSMQGSLSTSNIGTINHSGGAISLTGTLNNVGETFDLTSLGTLNLGGTLEGGTVVGNSASLLILSSSPTVNNISNVSLGVNVSIPSFSNVTFSGVQLIDNANIYLTAGTGLNVSGISGHGTVVLNAVADSSNYNSAITGTVEPNITLETGAYEFDYGGEATFSGTNDGLISSQTSSQIIQLTGSWSNATGSIQARNGGVISVASYPGSFGNFSVNNATLDIETSLTTAEVNTISASSAIFSVGSNGSVQNTGSNFLLTGNETLLLAGGTFTGGTISGTATDGVSVTTSNSNLQQTTVSLPITIQQGATLTATGVTLNNSSINMLGSSLYSSAASLNGSVLGNGQIVFETNLGNSISANFVIAPGITVRTGTGSGYVSGGAVNDGRILSGVSGQTITVGGYDSGAALINSGTVQASNGGLVAVNYSNWQNAGSLSLVDGGKITVPGIIFETGSALDLSWDDAMGPGILSIAGNLNLADLPLLNVIAPTGQSGSFEFASYTGTLTGEFSLTSSQYTVNYSHPGEIFLNVPEPVTLNIFAVAAFAMTARRRSRCAQGT